ncbi:transposase [Aneurinibacillus sp. Ricciae_BoGa-3]|uniref:transposase n=1 Tax=Aneurinibacillus sp. Ricciae_BoGa-3 TaxID=3022697 RepID=UPI003FA4705C
MGRTIETALVFQAYQHIKAQLYHTKDLIIHSDQGSNILNFIYRSLKSRRLPRLLFTKYPYDNACIESFHSFLKKELVYRTRFNDFEEAKRCIFQYIEGWYNNRRIHSALGYRTPNEYAYLLAQQQVSFL